MLLMFVVLFRWCIFFTLPLFFSLLIYCLFMCCFCVCVCVFCFFYFLSICVRSWLRPRKHNYVLFFGLYLNFLSSSSFISLFAFVRVRVQIHERFHCVCVCVFVCVCVCVCVCVICNVTRFFFYFCVHSCIEATIIYLCPISLQGRIHSGASLLSRRGNLLSRPQCTVWPLGRW